MRTDKVLEPYSAPADFRAYVYDAIVLPWETKDVNIISSRFSKKILEQECGLDISMLHDLYDVQQRDEGTWSKKEFLIFYKNGQGYECLFKRLRDTFAHGHYEQSKQGWITIRHRYKDSHNKLPNTRIFGNLRISTLKKIIAFLNTTPPPREAPARVRSRQKNVV